MENAKKITIEVPGELLKKAQDQTGKGISETVRNGLKLLAASSAYSELRELKGKVKFSKTVKELREDRK